MSETSSKTISFIRIPLTVLILFFHTTLTNVMINGELLVKEGTFPIHDLLYSIIGVEIAGIGVPAFFLISAYLFFLSKMDVACDRSYVSVYWNKIQKRFKSLFIPFVAWNLIYVVIIWCAQTFMSSSMSGRTELVSEFSAIDWLRVFWDIRIGSPMDTPLWFIRDLMIAMLFAPIFLFLIKKLKYFFPLAICLIWVLGLFENIGVVKSISIVFFSIGAWLGINKIDFIERLIKYRFPSLISYSIVLLLSALTNFNGGGDLHKLGLLLGVMTAFAWSGDLVKTKKISDIKSLSASTFFIYAYHIMPLLLVTKFWVSKLPMNEVTMCIGYFVIPLIVFAIGLMLYHLSKIIFKQHSYILTGGR